MESRNYTLISAKDVQEMKENSNSKSLEDFLEDSLKKLPGTIRDREFHNNLALLEDTMGEEDFERLQALTKKRYEALVALERNGKEDQGKKDAEALWDAYKEERTSVLRFAANGAKHSLGQFTINKTTVGDVIREADFRLQKFAEKGFENANGAELAELLTFQRNENSVSLAQWFKIVFSTVFVHKPRQAVEFKQLPPLEIPRVVPPVEMKKPNEPVVASDESDEALARKLQEDFDMQDARTRALEREGLASPEADQEEIRLQEELLAYYESQKKPKCEVAKEFEPRECQVLSSEAKVMQLLSDDRRDQCLAVNLQLEVYEKLGPIQASQVADLKEDKDRYQLAANVQQQELSFYKQEMENLRLTEKFLDEEEKDYCLRR